jgi:glycosyltransferase involved in cell wall biosynthesis
VLAPRHAVIVDAYPHLRYGAQETARTLARALPAAGWSTEVVTPGPGPFVDRLRADGITVTVLDVPAPLARYGGRWSAPAAGCALVPVWVRLARHLRGRAGVVHANDHRGMLLAGPAARLAGVPLVWHVHYVQRTPALTRLGRLLAARVLVCSAATARDTPGLGRATVVPNAIDDRFCGPPPARPTAGTGGPLLVTVGRIHPDKGLDVLLDALALARREVPGLRLAVVGDTTPGAEAYRDALLRRVAALGLDRAVEWCGWLANPEQVLAGAAAYVQASRHEPFGVAVAEAMACGIPVVVTDAGGLAEVVDGGRCGLVVPAEDPGALAAALVRVVTDSGLAARLATGGRAHALATFTPERLAHQVAAVYDEIRGVPVPARR